MSFGPLATKGDITKLQEQIDANYNDRQELWKQYRDLDNRIAGINSRQELVRNAVRRLNKHGKNKGK